MFSLRGVSNVRLQPEPVEPGGLVHRRGLQGQLRAVRCRCTTCSASRSCVARRARCTARTRLEARSTSSRASPISRPTRTSRSAPATTTGSKARVPSQGTLVDDHIAARVAFSYTKADGWFKNVLPGSPDLEGVDQYGIRASVLFKANDDSLPSCAGRQPAEPAELRDLRHCCAAGRTGRHEWRGRRLLPHGHGPVRRQGASR